MTMALYRQAAATFECQECGKKLRSTSRACSRCGSTDIDVYVPGSLFVGALVAIHTTKNREVSRG